MGKLISVIISIGLLVVANQAATKWHLAGAGSNENQQQQSTASGPEEASANGGSPDAKVTNVMSNNIIESKEL